MPIVFEQAAPMAPDITAGGGRAEVATRDLPTIAGMYEAANRNQLAASEATARNATQSGIAGAQIANQSSMEADRLGLQRYEFDRSREVSERDNFQANLQAHAAQQHAELQSWLSGQELSQAESLRLQRMQNAVGDISARTDLDDETKKDLLFQLKTGIDPLKQRLESSRAKLEMQQTKKLFDANARQASMENMDAGARSAEFQKRVVSMTNPQTGEDEQFYTDHKGDLMPVPFGGSKGSKAAAADSTKEEAHYVDQRLKFQTRLDKRIEDAEKRLQDMNKPDSQFSPADRAAQQAKLDDLRTNEQIYLKADLEKAGLGYTWDAHQQKRNPQREGLPGSMSDQGRPEGANQGSGEGGPAQEPTPAKSMPVSKPEDVQKTSDSMREKAKAATWLPEDKRKELVGLIDERAKILADYSGKITPPAVWQRLDQITAALKGVPKEPPPDPRKRPVPPVHQPDWLERNIVGPADRFLQGFPGAGAGTPGPGPA